MSAFATDTEKLRELDAGTRRAWAAYSDRLRELTERNTSRPSGSPGRSCKASSVAWTAAAARCTTNRTDCRPTA